MCSFIFLQFATVVFAKYHYLGSLMQHLYSATLHVNTMFQGSIMTILHGFVKHFSSGGRPLLLIYCLSKMIGSKIFQLYVSSFDKLASMAKFFNYKVL